MNMKYKSAVILIIVSFIIFTFGCSHETKACKTVAYIFRSKSIDYEKMFDDSKLGKIYHYEYKLVNPDKNSILI